MHLIELGVEVKYSSVLLADLALRVDEMVADLIYQVESHVFVLFGRIKMFPFPCRQEQQRFSHQTTNCQEDGNSTKLYFSYHQTKNGRGDAFRRIFWRPRLKS